MSSNCLVSIFSCCSRKKREIAPLDITYVANHLQNAETQTAPNNNQVLSNSCSLPALRLSDRVAHKPTIMVRSGNSFHSQSSEEYSKLSIRNSSQFTKRDTNNQNIFKGRGDYKDWNYNSNITSDSRMMPKLNPVTPGKGIAIRLPEIKRMEPTRVLDLDYINQEI